MRSPTWSANVYVPLHSDRALDGWRSRRSRRSRSGYVSSSADIDGWRAVLTDVTCPALLFVGDATVDNNVTVRDAEAREAQHLRPALEVVRVPVPGTASVVTDSMSCRRRCRVPQPACRERGAPGASVAMST